MKKYILSLAAVVLTLTTGWAQNSLTIYLNNGSNQELRWVDTVTYSVADSATEALYMNVQTFDSTYRFAVAEIDSMKYLPSTMHGEGKVAITADPAHRLSVYSLMSEVPLADTSFSLDVFRSDIPQLLMVGEVDSLPMLLYRGVISEGQPVRIDARSTALALITSYPLFATLTGDDYNTIVEYATSTFYFDTLCARIATSVAEHRSIVDSNTNRALRDAIDSVITEIFGDTTGWEAFEALPDSRAKVNMSRERVKPFEITSSGSVISIRMVGFSPTYFGTISDEDGVELYRNFMVPTRGDFGIMDLVIPSHRTLYSTPVTFDMSNSGEGKRYFDFTCRNAAALQNLTAHIISNILGIAGVKLTAGSQSAIADIVSMLLSSTIVWREGGDAASGLLPVVGAVGSIMARELAASGLQTLAATAAIRACPILNAYNIGKNVGNAALRIVTYMAAPSDVHFCLEWYTGDEVNTCSDPVLTCTGGNGQRGDANEALAMPITLQVVCSSANGAYIERDCTIKIDVPEGCGSVSEQEISIRTSAYDYAPATRQFTWTLGDDDQVPQKIYARLYPAGSTQQLGETVEIVAFFRQEEEHIDSFQIAANRFVRIAKGNLQYNNELMEWRFAEHQYDYIGENNPTSNADYSGWMDLFSWNTANNPAYFPRSNYDYEQGLYSIFTDWGANPISNGGNQANMWFTPELAHWNYLLTRRPNATSLRGYATVCGVGGMIILPNNWQLPEGATFNAAVTDWSDNVYDTESWSVMEEAGAIFLPAAGHRTPISAANSTLQVGQVQHVGAYWTAKNHTWYPEIGYDHEEHAYRLSFWGDPNPAIRPLESVRCFWGLSVRLMQNL